MSRAQISQEVHTALNWMDREQIVDLLKGISIQCYDHESDQVLREAIIQNIDDGTLEESVVLDSLDAARDRQRNRR